jgi:hypothetical protein
MAAYFFSKMPERGNYIQVNENNQSYQTTLKRRHATDLKWMRNAYAGNIDWCPFIFLTNCWEFLPSFWRAFCLAQRRTNSGLWLPSIH